MSKIEGGYYIMARKVSESEIANAPPHVREIWHYLIRVASHRDQKQYSKNLKRGQILTSYDEIREALHWKVGYRKQRYTKGQCEIAMKFLRKGSMITTTKTTRGMIITICNYDYYQDPKNYESHNENYNENSSWSQPHDTINKKYKNGKNEEMNKEERGVAAYCTDLVSNASSPAQDQEQPSAGFSLIPDTKKPKGRPTYPPGWINVTTDQGEALCSISDWYLKTKNKASGKSIFPDVYKAVTMWLKNGVHPDALIELLEYVKNDKEIGEINSYYAYFQRALMVESPNRHEAEYIKKTRKQIADAEGVPGDLLQKIMKECKIKDMS